MKEISGVVTGNDSCDLGDYIIAIQTNEPIKKGSKIIITIEENNG